ncbi:TolC family protein [Acidobacteriota bacterium]
MKKVWKWFTLLICLSLPLYSAMEENQERMELSLKNCLLKALENNLDIAVAEFDPQISDMSISQAKEKYYPELSMGYYTTKQVNPSTWGLEGLEAKTDQNYVTFDVRQSFVTGGSLSFNLFNQSTDTTRAFTQVNPSFYNRINLTFTQPLLKGFGPKISNYDIHQAENSKEISVYGLKTTIQQKVLEVEDAYWNLVSQIESLKVRMQSLEQNKREFEKAQEAARMGVKSAMDVIQRETEVARLEDQVLNDQNMIDTYEDRLKQLMNIRQDGPFIQKAIVPLDKPVFEENRVPFQQALDAALSNRPDMASTLKQLENSDLSIGYYRNQFLPQLDLELRLWSPGQSGVRDVYQDNNPLTGIIIDQITGSRWDSFLESIKRSERNWSINLNLTVPIANLFSRAGYVSAKLQKEKTQMEMERLRVQITNELIQVYKELENKSKRIKSTALYSKMAEKQLEAETQRYELGLVTSQWLVNYQSGLTSAKVEEIKAIIAYKIALARLEKYMGTNLKTHNLKYRSF